MRIQELMTHPVFTCHTGDTLAEAARLMWEHDCGVVPVVDADGALAGIITDRDICMAAYTQGRTLAEMHVGDVMAKRVLSVDPDTTIAEAEKVMADGQVHRVPVVDAARRPIGMLSLNDLAREITRPGSRLRDGLPRFAQTVAAVARPREIHSA